MAAAAAPAQELVALIDRIDRFVRDGRPALSLSLGRVGWTVQLERSGAGDAPLPSRSVGVRSSPASNGGGASQGASSTKRSREPTSNWSPARSSASRTCSPLTRWSPPASARSTTRPRSRTMRAWRPATGGSRRMSASASLPIVRARSRVKPRPWWRPPTARSSQRASPGSAPSMTTGPVTGFTLPKSSFARSDKVESGDNWPPEESMVSNSTVSPGATVSLGGLALFQPTWLSC